MKPPKKTAKRKQKPAPKDTRPQRERFIEAANKAGVDADAFERVMGKLLPAKKPKR